MFFEKIIQSWNERILGGQTFEMHVLITLVGELIIFSYHRIFLLEL